jgi:FtsP/CotA-like multicopper oxidase with cupredoxin domain
MSYLLLRHQCKKCQFYNRLQRIILSARGGGDHPFHLHGGDFHVVALGVIEGNISTEIVRELNERNNISKNLNGTVKDTVSVPSSGYAVIRFVADNPGEFQL